MARRELGPASLLVAMAVARALPRGRVIVGCSGGADSVALAMGSRWAAARSGADVHCVVVDHDLQPASADVAQRVAGLLAGQGISAEVRRIAVDADLPGGVEAAARDARLECLASDGLPVLLGHTLDDQAESVLLGLLRGSGTRSLAGMAGHRGPFIRPLLGIRRAATVAACDEWDIDVWQDPHNIDESFRRVRVRNHLADLSNALGQDLAPSLARSATLARMDADLLDSQAAEAVSGLDLTGDLSVGAVASLPEALRLRVVRDWLTTREAPQHSMAHVVAVDALITAWRGQGPVSLPGGRVERLDGMLRHSLR